MKLAPRCARVPVDVPLTSRQTYWARSRCGLGSDRSSSSFGASTRNSVRPLPRRRRRRSGEEEEDNGPGRDAGAKPASRSRRLEQGIDADAPAKILGRPLRGVMRPAAVDLHLARPLRGWDARYSQVRFSSCSGYRTPSIWIVGTAPSMTRGSSGVNWTLTAPRFSSSRLDLVDPQGWCPEQRCLERHEGIVGAFIGLSAILKRSLRATRIIRGSIEAVERPVGPQRGSTETPVTDWRSACSSWPGWSSPHLPYRRRR